MQLLAKFKIILYIGFRATLNFPNLKVALNPMYRILLDFGKSCISSCLLKFYNNQKFTVPFLKYKCLKLKLGVSLGGHSVAMVTCYVTKIMPTCSLVIGWFFKSWNVLETVLSHLKQYFPWQSVHRKLMLRKIARTGHKICGKHLYLARKFAW